MTVLLVSEIIYALIGFAGGIVAALAVFAAVFLTAVLREKKKSEKSWKPSKRRRAESAESAESADDKK